MLMSPTTYNIGQELGNVSETFFAKGEFWEYGADAYFNTSKREYKVFDLKQHEYL